MGPQSKVSGCNPGSQSANGRKQSPKGVRMEVEMKTSEVSSMGRGYLQEDCALQAKYVDRGRIREGYGPKSLWVQLAPCFLNGHQLKWKDDVLPPFLFLLVLSISFLKEGKI